MFDDDESDELDEFAESSFSVSRFSRKEMNRVKSRIRNAISRESSQSDKRRMEMVSYLLNHANNKSAIEESPFTKKSRKAHAVIVGISRLSSSVLNSLGVTAPIRIDKTFNHSVAFGKTDFKSIHIGVNTDFYNENDRDAIANILNMTKGLVYHEGGHIKFTTPYPNLIDMSGFDISVAHRFDYMKAWNILEDQRMETAMCCVSPIFARYFTNIVLNVVINLKNLGSNWPWIAGRTYLPKDIRQAIRDEAEFHMGSHLIDDINRCIMTYRNSKDAKEMMRCVIEFQKYLDQWGSGGKSSDSHEWVSSTEGDVPNPSDIPDMGNESLETPTTTRPAEACEGDTSKPEGEEETKSKLPDTNTGSSAGAPSPEEKGPSDVERERKLERDKDSRDNTDTVKDRAKEEIDKNNESISDAEVNEFVSTVNEILSKDMLPDPTLTPMNVEERRKSDEVAGSMMDVLERLVVNVDPTWTSYMEDGILDPALFAMRDPGDTNFWRGLDNEGAHGHDLAVSVLLDSSGSMCGEMHKVSIAAMGIRKACDALEIPCTITSFNDDVYMVADANEKVDYVRIDSTGGTAIINAMMGLEQQKCGKNYHIVIILTDGEWYDVTDVRMWSQPQRQIVIAGFGNIERYISTKGADNWLIIDDLMELPNIVTDSLVKHFV